MDIVFDIDGTLTNFNEFIEKNAFEYFIKKYNFEVRYPEKLEIEDIFDIKNTLMERNNISEEEADKMTKKILDNYWIGLNFVKFSLFGKFRDNVRETINYLSKKGFNIKIISSRLKASKNDIVGTIARDFTYLQFVNNGVFINKNNFYFCENDEEKMKLIDQIKPLVIFEDKEHVINALSKNHKIICVNGIHNQNVVESKNVLRIDNYSVNEIEEKIKKLLGKSNYECFVGELDSQKCFNGLKVTAPIINAYFKPIVLHEDLKVKDGEKVLYAPNHRSTLDPIAITGYLLENIHWAALKRFFDGKDSIFNNSKNKVLCDITSYYFNKLKYFPIERKSDNPDANNYDSIKNMNTYLKNGCKVGIFAEGTTRREEGKEFGTFDDGFINLAKSSGAWIQPITNYWIKDDNIENKIIINFGEPFKVDKMTRDEAMQHFLSIQEKNLQENKVYAEKLKNSKTLVKK